MPIELQVIRASEFIRLDAREHFDLAASKEVLRALAQACRKRSVDCAMLDLRMLPVPAKPYLTTAEIVALVGTFREAGFSRRQRLAILYRIDVHGGVRNFAFISRMRGLQVHAFNEFESALYWLAEEQAKPVKRGSQGVPIPITKWAGEVKKRPARSSAASTGKGAGRPVGSEHENQPHEPRAGASVSRRGDARHR